MIVIVMSRRLDIIRSAPVSGLNTKPAPSAAKNTMPPSVCAPRLQIDGEPSPVRSLRPTVTATAAPKASPPKNVTAASAG